MQKVISVDQLPSRAPNLFTAVVWLVLDRLQPAAWVCGVVWTMVALCWVAFLITFFKVKQVKLQELE